MSGQAAALLAALLLTHYLGDFTPLATPRMLEAKANGGPLLTIAGHALVHTSLVVIVIVLLADPAYAILAAAGGIEFITHFALDAGRAPLNLRQPALNDTRRRAFWYLLGADQLGHAVVLVALVALIV